MVKDWNEFRKMIAALPIEKHYRDEGKRVPVVLFPKDTLVDLVDEVIKRGD